MDIAKLVAKLELQSSQFQSELEKTNRKLLGFQAQSTKALTGIEKQAKAFGRALTGMFAGLSISTAASAIKSAIDLGDEIGKAAVKAGIGAQAMSELAFAARMADVDLAGLSNSIRFMQVSLSKASTGGKEQLEVLKALGLQLSAIQRLSPDKQFEAFAGAIASLKDPADKARAAVTLFGKSGADLLPLFEDGAEGIRKAREEAQKFGASFSDDVIKTLQEGDDAIKKIGITWDVFWAHVATGAIEYAGAVADATEKMKKFLTQQGDGMRALRVAGSSLPIIGPLLLGAEIASQAPHTEIFPSERGLGGRGRGSGAKAPGFAAGEAIIPDAFTSEMRENIAQLQRWRDLIDDVDSSQHKWLESTMDLTDELQDIPEPILQLSDSLIQADELQKEFTRSMFDNFSELFMSIGTGASSIGESLINTFKRVLADSATLQLFDLLGGLGSSLTGSSGGKGFAGFIGAGLSSLFGGTKAEGGPLQQGKWYIAGEHGPEPVWGGGAGAFAMGYGGGGGMNVTIAPVFNNVKDLSDAKMLQYAKTISDATVARIRDERRRGRF